LSAETKLLFLIRHGQAWSNYLEEVLGPDLWYGVVSKCGFTTGNGTDYQIFDAGELCQSMCALWGLTASDKCPVHYPLSGHTIYLVNAPQCINTSMFQSSFVYQTDSS